MGFFGEHLLSTILFTPLFGAVLLVCVGAGEKSAIRWIAAVFGALTMCVSLPLWFRFQPFGEPWQFVERGPWIRPVGAAYTVGIDGVSALLVLLATLVGAIAILASWAVSERVKEYCVLVLLAEAGLIGALVSLDALLFLLFFELTLVPAVLLIGSGSGSRRLASAIRLLLPGAAVLLIAILAPYFVNHAATGISTFDLTEWQRLSMSIESQRWMFVAFLLGFTANAAILPVRLWRRDATDAVSAGGVLVFAAAMLSLGTYGLVRFTLPMLPDATRDFAPAAEALSGTLLIGGAVAAFVQTDWRRAIACAAVSQMGLVALGIFSLTPAGFTGGVVQQLSQALCTAALLLIPGMAPERGEGLGIGRHDGLATRTPLPAAALFAVTLASTPLPALSGFVGTLLILQGLYVAHPLWMAVAALGTVLGSAHLLSLYRRTMAGTIDDPVARAPRDLNGRELATLLPLMMLVVWVGVHPEPVLRRLQSSVGRVVVRVNPVYGPAIAQAEAACNAAAAPPAVPDAPAGLMVAPPCETPVAPSAPAGRPEGR